MKCFEEKMNWNTNYTTDWSAESATNVVMDGKVFMNMLRKDHIYIVQGSRLGASGIPYYCAPLVCVSVALGGLAVCWHNKPKSINKNLILVRKQG